MNTYKVRIYTKEIRSSWVYAVLAENGEEAIAAAKMHLKRMGFTPYRAYHSYELDGIINAKEELPF